MIHLPRYPSFLPRFGVSVEEAVHAWETRPWAQAIVADAAMRLAMLARIRNGGHPMADGVSRRRQRGFFTLPGGMGALKPSSGPTDPYFGSVVLLVTAATDDISPINHSVTVGGGAPATDTSVFGYSPSSANYPNSSSWDLIADNASARLGTSDFIAEIIGRPTGAFGSFGAFYSKGVNASDGVTFAMSSDGLRFRAAGTNDLDHSVSISTTTFSYAAYIREGTTRRIYYASTVGGVATQVKTDTLSFNASSADAASLGCAFVTGFWFQGWLHCRITKGTTRGITGGADYTSPSFFPTN